MTDTPRHTLRQAPRQARRRPVRKARPTAQKPRDVRFRILAEHSRDLFFSMRFPEGSYEYVSPSYGDITGHSPEEFYDDPGILFRIIAPAWRQQVACWLEEIRRGQAQGSYEFQILDRHGRLRWLHQRQVLVPAPGGRGLLLQGVATDITELREAQAELRESEERFRILVEHSRDVFFSFHLSEGRYEFISAKVEDILGHAPQAFYDDPGLFLRCVAPAWREIITGWMAEAHQGILRDRYEYEVLDRHGRLRWVEERLVLVPAPDGRGKLLQGVAADITEERGAREALRESHARYALLAENVVDVIWTTDPDLRWTYLSPSAEKLSGLPMERLMAASFAEVFTPESLRTIEEIMTLRGQAPTPEERHRPYRVELDLRHTDGSLVPLEVMVRPMLGPEKEITGYCGTARDITERRQAEAALLKSERLARKILNSLHEGVWALDADRRTTFVNERMADMLGYSVAELMDLTPHHVLEGPPKPQAEARFLDRAQGHPGAMDYVMLRKDGSRLPVRVASSPIMESQGRFEGLVSGVVDLTEKERMEEELRRNQARFEALAELSRLTEATEAEMAAFTLREAIRLTDSSAGVIFFSGADKKSLTPLAWEGGNHNPGGPPPSVSASGPLPWDAVFQSGKPLVRNDFSVNAARMPDGHPPVARFLGVPALDGEAAAAVLGLTGKAQPYTPGDTLQVSLLLDSLWRIMRSRRDEEQIRASLRAQEALLREVHHRVKNNLQVVSSLLDMAGRRLTSGEARHSLAEVRAKVQAMSLIHAQLHSTDTGGGISLERFVRALFHQLRELYSGDLSLSLVVELSKLALGLDQAVPLGLALNEALTNVFKHASAGGRAGQVAIRAGQDAKGQICILVRDNGPGLPEGLDPAQAQSLGMKLMYGLVRHQLGGKLEILSCAAPEPPGVEVCICFRSNVA